MKFTGEGHNTLILEEILFCQRGVQLILGKVNHIKIISFSFIFQVLKMLLILQYYI